MKQLKKKNSTDLSSSAGKNLSKEKLILPVSYTHKYQKVCEVCMCVYVCVRERREVDLIVFCVQKENTENHSFFWKKEVENLVPFNFLFKTVLEN